MNRNGCRCEATGLCGRTGSARLNSLKEQEASHLARALLVQHPLMLQPPLMTARLRSPALVVSSALVLAASLAWLQRAGAGNSAVLLLALATGLAAACTVLVRRGEGARHERELIAALGEPLLAARPFEPAALQALARQLAEHWFVAGRRLLPVVAFAEGASAVLAAELGRALAALGVRTLLVDADLRTPRLHERFAVPKGEGLADALDAFDMRGLRLAACGANLALFGAGRVRQHPLELLSRARLRGLLGAAGQPFQAVLVCSPCVPRGPDFEIFAALAGGALVLAGPRTRPGELAALRRQLERCAARLVATLVERG